MNLRAHAMVQAFHESLGGCAPRVITISVYAKPAYMRSRVTPGGGLNRASSAAVSAAQTGYRLSLTR